MGIIKPMDNNKDTTTTFLDAVIEENKRLQRDLKSARKTIIAMWLITIAFCAMDAAIIVKFWL